MRVKRQDTSRQLCLQEALALVQSALKMTNKLSNHHRADSLALLSHIFSCPVEDFYRDADKVLTKKQNKDLDGLILRLKKLEPIAYILAYQDFWESSFHVNKHVLIPRPETEILLEKVLDLIGDLSFVEKRSLRVLDIACGSGCIGLSLVKASKNLSCDLWDICEQAVALSQKNLKALGLDPSRAKVLLKDALQPKNWENLDKYDILVANPPYIAKEEIKHVSQEVLDFEPHKALFAGDGGLEFYFALARLAPLALKEGGSLFVEVGFQQANKVSEIFLENGFKNIEISKDYNGHNRVVKGSL